MITVSVRKKGVKGQANVRKPGWIVSGRNLRPVYTLRKIVFDGQIYLTDTEKLRKLALDVALREGGEEAAQYYISAQGTGIYGSKHLYSEFISEEMIRKEIEEREQIQHSLPENSLFK